ncbi:hypothetical protein ACI65C_007393 [Semiaphis heraclei]
MSNWALLNFRFFLCSCCFFINKVLKIEVRSTKHFFPVKFNEGSVYKSVRDLNSGITHPFVQIYSLFPLKSSTTNQKPKMGAEKVSMNIVVVGQVQSAKAIKSVAKATPATSQLMIFVFDAKMNHFFTNNESEHIILKFVIS